MSDFSIHTVLKIALTACLFFPASLFAQDSDVKKDIDIILSASAHNDCSVCLPLDAQAAYERLKASPSKYIVEIDNRFVSLDVNQLDSLSTFHSYYSGGLWGVLSGLVYREIGGNEAVSVLVRWNLEAANDIQYLTEKELEDPDSKTEVLNQAKLHAMHLYIHSLQVLETMRDGTLLEDALARHSSMPSYVQIYIESYALSIMGAFPPPDSLTIRDLKNN